jgi:hypothetical protein
MRERLLALARDIYDLIKPGGILFLFILLITLITMGILLIHFLGWSP